MTGLALVLTGASEAGKTTIADAIKKRQLECAVLHFNTVDVPSREVWQASTTAINQMELGSVL